MSNWVWLAGVAGAGMLGYSMMGGSANRQSAASHPDNQQEQLAKQEKQQRR